MSPSPHPVRALRGLGKDPRRWLRALRYAAGRLGGQLDYTRFAIVSRSRSGSNLLASLLDDHPEIRVEGEILGRLDGCPPGVTLSRLFGPHPRGVRAVGFKYFYYHPVDGDPDEGAAAVEASVERVIHLRRANPIRIEVSRRIAAESGRWSERRGPRVPAAKRRVALPPGDLIRRLRRTRAWEDAARTRWAGSGYLEITYEQLVANRSGTLAKIQGLLGVGPHEVQSPLRRQNPEPLPALLANYDELREALAGTEWGPLLDD